MTLLDEKSGSRLREADDPMFNGLIVDACTLRNIERFEDVGYLLSQTGVPSDPAFRDVLQDMQRLKRDYLHQQGNATDQRGGPVTIDLLFVKN